MRIMLLIFLLLFSTCLQSASGDLIWSYKTGNFNYGTPYVVDGVLYVGSGDHKIYALNALTGSLIWSYETDGMIHAGCIVDNGILFIGSFDRNMYAMNASTGSPIWAYPTRDAIRSTPAVSNGIVYFGSADNSIYAVDVETGNQIWEYETDYDVTSSPVCYNSTVYNGSWDGNIYAINASNGQLKWKYLTTDWIISGATIYDSVVYFGCDDGFVYALNSSNGGFRWRYETKNRINSSPATSDSTVFIGSNDSYFYAIDTVTGQLKWKANLSYPVYLSSAGISDGYAYIGCSGKTLYALNKHDGKIMWQYKTTGEIFSSIFCHDSKVYFSSKDQYIYCLDATVLNLLVPNGGEIWEAGSTQEIKWDASANYNDFKIEYTTDAGNSWIYIANVTGVKNHLWTVPQTPSDACLMKITSGSTIEQSDNFFTIYSTVGFKEKNFSSSIPLKTVISPNPFNRQLYFRSSDSARIYSLTGQLIKILKPGNYNIDTSSWKPGVYIFKSLNYTKRMIKISS
ncbi:MAG: PQQ-binding-like beta-propeller repeat protein [Candidatus Coatesbacteria bacterium]|nr:PQQ-binding-like beta-propeller repeat protein [Candidatus Coatesbacteria bacterium]